MAMLDRATFRDKVLGCWLGKSIGGTLGAPFEGRTERLSLKFYDPVPDGAVPNDDLDLQLVWLSVLRQTGAATDEHDLAEAWRAHLQYPFDEYGIALWNLGRGLPPALSGRHANSFGDCMGAPIRSEIWACIAPGCPRLAAAYAYADAVVDHDGEGVWGEVFLAALESAAFVTRDVDKLLDVGLSTIPGECRVAGAVRLVREQFEQEADWVTAREVVLARFGHSNFTDAPQNVAFSVLGWLWGHGTGDKLCRAVNCGYDTDCTGATLGAVLGILGGAAAFDAKWRAPIGDAVAVGWGVHDCVVPATLDELTDWTVEVAEIVLQANEAPVQLGDAHDLKGYRVDTDAGRDLLAARLEHHGWSVRKRSGDTTVWLDLGGPPALRAHESRVVELEIDGPLADGLTVEVPELWLGEPIATRGERRSARIEAPANIAHAPFWPVALRLGDGLEVGWSFVPGCGWRVAGPLELVDLRQVHGDYLDLGEGDERWTPDHRLVLDQGAGPNRLYRVRTALTVPSARPARLVSATPELQRVWVDGREVLRKEELTLCVPAPHRSGPGTAAELGELAAGPHEVEVLLAAGAGRPALLDLYLTRPHEEPGPRLVPWEDQVHTVPRRIRITP